MRKLSGKSVLTVVIPVFNALPETLHCLSSVVSNRTFPYRVLIIDDYSDKETASTLEQVSEEHGFIHYRRNDRNIGFTCTVNRAINLIPDGDIILLNSDTIVTSGWAEKLTAAAYAQTSVATVTPLSNAAGAFSIPVNNLNNELRFGLSPEHYNRLLENITHRLRPQVPTGNGFCLYVTRQALGVLKGFDEGNFPRGYGEENDFSMRAKQAGFINIIDDSTFIFHTRSASFGPDRKRLVEEGTRRLKALHPSYKDEVREWLSNDPLDTLREKFSEALATRNFSPSAAWNSVLYILHDGEGGVRYTTDDLIKSVASTRNAFVLRCGITSWELSCWTGRGFDLQRVYRFNCTWSPFLDKDSEREHALDSIIDYCRPGVVHIRHFIGLLPEFVLRVRRPFTKVVVSLHDMYVVCPTIHLHDERMNYCGGICTEGPGPCPAARKWFGNTLDDLKHNRVFEHRERMARGLVNADCLVTTSNSARTLLVEKLLRLRDARWEIIEHGRNLTRQKLRSQPTGRPIRIVAFGALGYSKGEGLFHYLLRRNLESGNRFEFHFLGRGLGESETIRDLGGVLHGGYVRDELARKMASIRPSLALLLSTVPETYCHTLTEAWSMGLPVIVSDLGALGERVRKHGGGWIVDYLDPEGCWKALCETVGDTRDYDAVAEQVDRIVIRTVAEMTVDYMSLYASLPDMAKEFV